MQVTITYSIASIEYSLRNHLICLPLRFRVCCGGDFTVFVTDNGIVMTCGMGEQGCLGHGDWSNSSKPKLIEALLSFDVTCVSCGPAHVAVVTSDGIVFTWGCGNDGRLGHGDEDNQ